MMKKKKFAISNELSRGFSETVNAVKNDDGVFRATIVPLSRIELDPDNPRKLSLNLDDIRNGLQENDPLFENKTIELERITELANTIESSGLINPIVVYKRGDVYRVVAGERRCLASLYLGKTEIDARVFDEKPQPFELKLIQWVENTARQDLSLKERLGNIKDIINEYGIKNNGAKISSRELSKFTGISKSQANCYTTVLNASNDVLDLIEQDKLNNLDKATILANVSNKEEREKLINEYISGTSAKEMRKIISAVELKKKPQLGRVSKKINMGHTNHTKVVEYIVAAVINHKSTSQHSGLFKKVDWSHPKQAKDAFKKLINLLEKDIKRL